MANLSHKSGKLFLLLGTAMLLLASCTESVAPVYEGSPISIIEGSHLDDLEHEFLRHNYDLSRLQQGVPPMIVEQLPGEFPALRPLRRRKSLFFQTLLPMVLLANREIAHERDLLNKLAEQTENGLPLDAYQLHQLRTLQARYAVKGPPTAESTLAKLKTRIDQVPPELVLAQAANESAWGTSRFSRQGNNLFGEWTFTPGTGIIPEERPDGATYEVRRFNTLYDSIRSYLRNLNTHAAYKPFRELRASLRREGQPLSGVKLAEGLIKYSTRREEYVSDLQKLIQQNNLQRFAAVNLRQS